MLVPHTRKYTYPIGKLPAGSVGFTGEPEAVPTVRTSVPEVLMLSKSQRGCAPTAPITWLHPIYTTLAQALDVK